MPPSPHVGIVTSLAINGNPVDMISFNLWGPVGDRHFGDCRLLSGHDGEYIRTSDLERGNQVFNWRTWTGLSDEEVSETEAQLGHPVPPGTVLENIRIAGIPNFSKLPPTSRLVFPSKKVLRQTEQAILAVWEENGPCRTAGERVAALYGNTKLTAAYVKSALNRRGVMGFVLASGRVYLGDEVRVYPPVT